MTARVAIAGGGAIARAYAALLARDGHPVALWSPRGQGLADLVQDATSGAWRHARGTRLAATGVVEGAFRVDALVRPDAIAEADVVLVAVPATAYATVLPRVAPHLRDGQTVFFGGALSLSPLWLSELAARCGARPTIAASGTTVATARSFEGGVIVNTIRSRVGVAALPVAATAPASTLLAQLFGDRFDDAGDVLAVTLANINPVAHAAMALTNLTRIECGEAWPQYRYLTPAVARLVLAMDAERQAIGAAFGCRTAPIATHFQRSFDVPQDDLHEIAAELHRRRGGPPGPTTLDTRFVLEDVPFGLACNVALARIAGVPSPVTAATIATLSALYGRDLGGDNPLPEALALAATSREALVARCRGTYP